MPFTVITLKNVPQSLRGDLTKWMQEIATGVYVGNYNSKVRDHLWKRVCDEARDGEATMCYAFRNEIGYQFETVNAARNVVDYDGIPLVKLPLQQEKAELKHGFSNAAKFIRAKRVRSVVANNGKMSAKSYVVIDIETTGLDCLNDNIIEIGALKCTDECIKSYQSLIQCNQPIPKEIVELTGISTEMLSESGRDLKQVLMELQSFIEDKPIIGYNVGFDLRFINHQLQKNGLPRISNKTEDLLTKVKGEKLFQKDYKLETSLRAYGIEEIVKHRALDDALLTNKLFLKMNKK